MTTFITDNFLLENKYAQILYHDYGKLLPIIDYHNHLIPKVLDENRNFENITQPWLYGDHYKWRAMRTLGIDEKFITGPSDDKEKFTAWADCVPYTMRNPIYHWTHLELLRYFHVDELLNAKSADYIYNTTKELLGQDSYSPMGLLKQMNVDSICTTDDPVDDLEHHKNISNRNESIKVYPTFRPDKAYAVEDSLAFNAYLKKMEQQTGNSINSFENLLEALSDRIHFFNENGCRLADHGLEALVFFEDNAYNEEQLFRKLKNNERLLKAEQDFFKYKVLLHLCKSYSRLGWVQQFHLGALRNTNHRMLDELGPDTGFDSIGDFSQAKQMAQFFNILESTDELAKSVIYNLNPSYNEVFATMVGNFNDGSVKGKIQFGSAWWFLDQKDGMEKQINSLSNLGLLSCFIGMLTDSRSLLSFPRHEYFRRILCNLIGKDVANGELPWDEKWLGKLVADIGYNNARDYLKLAHHESTS